MSDATVIAVAKEFFWAVFWFALLTSGDRTINILRRGRRDE